MPCESAVEWKRVSEQDHTPSFSLGIRIDSDPRIVEFSRRRTQEQDEIESLRFSAFDLERLEDYDFIFSNHLLHHFDYDEAAALLEAVGRKTRNRFLMNDLRRAKWPYIGYRIFSALFLHHGFAAYDGALSILRGFTPVELRKLSRRTSQPQLMRVDTTAPGRVFVLGEGNGYPSGEIR